MGGSGILMKGEAGVCVGARVATGVAVAPGDGVAVTTGGVGCGGAVGVAVGRGVGKGAVAAPSSIGAHAERRRAKAISPAAMAQRDFTVPSQKRYEAG